MEPTHPIPDAADRDFFARLRREVESQIAEYVYDSEAPVGCVGTRLSEKDIEDDLAMMRLCLVDPRWEDVEIGDANINSSTRHQCVVLAEDISEYGEGYALVFDPLDNAFALAYRQRGVLGIFGIRGNAVDCFLAR